MKDGKLNGAEQILFFFYSKILGGFGIPPNPSIFQMNTRYSIDLSKYLYQVAKTHL